MREILADLVAEQQGLDQFLQSIDYRKWPTATPAAGWTIHDQVSHLASTEELAFKALDEGAGAVAAVLAEHKTVDSFTEAGVARGREMRPGQVIEWWRHARADVVDALSRMTGKERLAWFAGDMSSKSFATVRLMETWAHGLDIKDALVDYLKISEEEDDPYADTPRLRHVAWLAHRMLRFAFDAEGEEFPESGIRVELVGPKFSRWVYGPEDTDQVIKGHAGEFCRVAVNRLDAEDTGLKTEGEYAEIALHLLRAY